MYRKYWKKIDIEDYIVKENIYETVQVWAIFALNVNYVKNNTILGTSTIFIYKRQSVQFQVLKIGTILTNESSYLSDKAYASSTVSTVFLTIKSCVPNRSATYVIYCIG